MVYGAEDFSSLQVASQPSQGAKRKGIDPEPRPYLKIFETLPPQLLNAYGESKFMKLDDKTVILCNSILHCFFQV